MATCSECGGSNAKKLSVIEKMGTNDTRMGQVILGAGTVTQKSKQASEASYKHSEEKGGFMNGLGCFVAIIMWALIVGALMQIQSLSNFFDSTVGSVVMFFLLIGLYGAWLQLPFMKNIESKNQAKRDEWAKTWMCLDCGHKWVGNK